VAGTRQLVRKGTIRKGDSVVAVLTGHLLKDPDAVMSFHGRRGRLRNPPVRIEPRLGDVERVLKRRRSG
jgi:threonine synthase